MQLSVKQPVLLVRYVLLFTGVIFLDRFTKYLALNHLIDHYRIAPFISFQTVLNRGIAGGIFNSMETAHFVFISLLVFITYGLLLYYTALQWKQNRLILAETLILAGGLSNIIDRFIYNGVVDFIVLSYKNWLWPVFNCADAFIVVGVLLMFASCIDNA